MHILLAGLEISEEGILICKDYSGRPSGEAYVEILNEEHFEAAVEKHNENMGHRWGHSFCYLALIVWLAPALE